MYLAGRKVKNVSFESGLEKAPIAIYGEEKERYVYNLRKGIITEEQRERLIEGHVGLALSIVGRYVDKQRSRAQDLVGVALLAICQAVNNFPSVAINNQITPYIVATIHSHVARYSMEDQIVKVPKDIVTKKAAEYRATGIKNFSEYKEFDPKLYGEVILPNGKGDDLREVLAKIQLTSGEKLLIQAKLIGYTEAEIAKHLHISRSKINQRVKLLKQKIYAVLGPDLQHKVRHCL